MIVAGKPGRPAHTDTVAGAIAAFASLAAGLWAAGAVAVVAPLIPSAVAWDGDVINRSVLEGYSKARETIIFVTACAVVPTVCAASVSLIRASRFGVVGLVATAALLSWPLHSLVRWPGWTGLAASGLVFLAVGGIRRLRVRAATPPDSAPMPLPPPVTAPRLHSITPVAAVVLAGIGLASVLTPGVNGNLESLRNAAVAALAWATATAAVVWVLVWRLVSWRGVRDRARQTATASILPLGGLVIANFDPCNEALRGVAAAAAAAAIPASVLLVLRWRMRPWISRLFWWGWVPAALYGACYVHDTRGPVDLYHDGERLTPAAAMAQGAIPYRDVFLWHGLVENGLLPQAGLSRQWSVHGVRVIQHRVEPLATVALYALLASCLRSPSAGMTATVLALFILPPANGRYCLPYLAYAAMTIWLTRRQRDHRWAMAAGFLAAAAAFHSLDGGSAALVATALALVYAATMGTDGRTARWWRGPGAVAVGALLGALIPLAYLARLGALRDFVSTSLSIIGGLSDRSSHPFPPLPRLEGGGVEALVGAYQAKATALYLCALLIIWGLSRVAVGRILKETNGSCRTLPVVVFGAAAFFRAVIRRPDMDHVTKVLPLVFVILMVLLGHHGTRCWRARRGIAALPHAAAVAVLVLLVLRMAMVDPETAPARILAERTHWQRDRNGILRPLRLERAGPGVEADPAHAAWIEDVVAHMETTLSADETFYDFTNGGLLYFLAGRPCPTRYVQTTYAASRAAQREVITALAAKRPRLVLFPSGDRVKYGYDRLIHPLRHPLITRYLYHHYTPSAMVGDAIVLEEAARAGRGHPPEVMNAIASMPFIVDVGHLPIVEGARLPASERIVRWDAKDILLWRGSKGLRLSPPSAGVYSSTAAGHAKVIASPRLAIEPVPEHAVVLNVGSDAPGMAHLMFSSDLHDALDGSATMAFWMEGKAVRSYVLDVGLLPAWVWRGAVTGLGLRFPDGSRRVVIQSVELHARAPDGAGRDASLIDQEAYRESHSSPQRGADEAAQAGRLAEE